MTPGERFQRNLGMFSSKECPPIGIYQIAGEPHMSPPVRCCCLRETCMHAAAAESERLWPGLWHARAVHACRRCRALPTSACLRCCSMMRACADTLRVQARRRSTEDSGAQDNMLSFDDFLPNEALKRIEDGLGTIEGSDQVLPCDCAVRAP
jgi:hypothetical protein